MISDELLYLWYGTIARMVHTQKMDIVMRFGGLRGLWDASESELHDKLTDIQTHAVLENRTEKALIDYKKRLLERDITYVYPGHECYPFRLYDIPDPPMLLFVAGDVTLLRDMKTALAVVGARKASVYGKTVTDRIVGYAAVAGVTIVSGMALGIDGAAHRAALTAGGRTVAVLGSGINVPYPRENYDIYHDIVKGGGVVVSESGLDVAPEAFRFPYRNRIISGMSDGVFVVEAREKSGSLITADQALEQGRDVYALPGRITDAASAGCNNLIRLGALCVTSPSDILDELGVSMPEQTFINKNLLAPKEKKVYSCVRLESRHVDDICLDAGIGVSEATQILFKLEQKKLIKQLVRNYYCRA